MSRAVKVIRAIRDHLESLGADLNGTSPAALAQRQACTGSPEQVRSIPPGSTVDAP